MHQHVVEAIAGYFQKKMAMPVPGIMQLFSDMAGIHPLSQYWLNVYDFDHYLSYLFRQAPKLITPGVFYHVAKTFLSDNVTPYKYYLQKMPFRAALASMELLGNTCHHAMPVKVIFTSKTEVLIKMTPYPYYLQVTKGTFCHFVRGITDALLTHRKLKDGKTRELCCSANLKTMIKKVYADFHWEYSEDEHWIYLNHQPLAEKMVFSHPLLDKPVPAARIIKDVKYEGVLLFKKGGLYNAPYCCLEAECPRDEGQQTDVLLRKMLEKSIMEMGEKEIIIFRHAMAKRGEHDWEEQGSKKVKAVQRINRAVRYIQLNYSRKITIKDLAQHTAMSNTHLTQLFRKQTGMSVTDYITQYRLKSAQNLLRNHHYPLTTVALQCGFGSAAHFCYVFKKHYHQTPKQYIKKHENLEKNE